MIMLLCCSSIVLQYYLCEDFPITCYIPTKPRLEPYSKPNPNLKSNSSPVKQAFKAVRTSRNVLAYQNRPPFTGRRGTSVLGSVASRGVSALGSGQYLISGVDLSVFSLSSERRVCVRVLSGTRCTIRSVLKFASASQAAAASQHSHKKKAHHKNTRPSTASLTTAMRRRSFRSEGTLPNDPALSEREPRSLSGRG